MSRKKRNDKAGSEESKQPHDRTKVVEFIQLTGFSEEWDDLDLLDVDLVELENSIMSNPSASPVVKGTGGLRKLRFSPTSWKKGKSGALRVCYVHFKEQSKVVLVIVYRKTDRDDISAEGRRAIRNFIHRTKQELAKL